MFKVKAITLSIFALIWSFLEIIYSEMGLFIGTVSVSSGEWSRYNYPLRKETISDIAIYAYCGIFGNLTHLVLVLTSKKTGYAVRTFDHFFAYMMLWPLNAIIIDTAKVMFAELRPNFLAMCFFNESTGTSRKFTASELALLDLDISDCPGPERMIRKGRVSFPSGHSSGAFLAATYSFLLATTVTPKVFRPIVLVLMMIFPIICAGSRYLDGYHHLHDVLIGACLGSLQAYYCYSCMMPGHVYTELKDEKRKTGISSE